MAEGIRYRFGVLMFVGNPTRWISDLPEIVVTDKILFGMNKGAYVIRHIDHTTVLQFHRMTPEGVVSVQPVGKN